MFSRGLSFALPSRPTLPYSPFMRHLLYHHHAICRHFGSITLVMLPASRHISRVDLLTPMPLHFRRPTPYLLSHTWKVLRIKQGFPFHLDALNPWCSDKGYPSKCVRNMEIGLQIST